MARRTAAALVALALLLALPAGSTAGKGKTVKFHPGEVDPGLDSLPGGRSLVKFAKPLRVQAAAEPGREKAVSFGERCQGRQLGGGCGRLPHRPAECVWAADQPGIATMPQLFTRRAAGSVDPAALGLDAAPHGTAQPLAASAAAAPADGAPNAMAGPADHFSPDGSMAEEDRVPAAALLPAQPFPAAAAVLPAQPGVVPAVPAVPVVPMLVLDDAEVLRALPLPEPAAAQPQQPAVPGALPGLPGHAGSQAVEAAAEVLPAAGAVPGAVHPGLLAEATALKPRRSPYRLPKWTQAAPRQLTHADLAPRLAFRFRHQFAFQVRAAARLAGSWACGLLLCLRVHAGRRGCRPCSAEAWRPPCPQPPTPQLLIPAPAPAPPGRSRPTPAPWC